MTIQQHASFDSSAAELNATSKLVKAWESKNAKNAAKAGGISLMALSLAACGGSSDTAPSTPAIETPVTPVVPTPGSFSLTSAFNAFVGGEGVDTFTAATAAVLQASDTLDGAGGVDTLSVSDAVTGGSYASATGLAGTISNIENLDLTTVGSVGGAAKAAAAGAKQVITITPTEVASSTYTGVTVTVNGVDYASGSLSSNNVTDGNLGADIKTQLAKAFGADVTIGSVNSTTGVFTVTADQEGVKLPEISIAVTSSAAYTATAATTTEAATQVAASAVGQVDQITLTSSSTTAGSDAYTLHYNGTSTSVYTGATAADGAAAVAAAINSLYGSTIATASGAIVSINGPAGVALPSIGVSGAGATNDPSVTHVHVRNAAEASSTEAVFDLSSNTFTDVTMETAGGANIKLADTQDLNLTSTDGAITVDEGKAITVTTTGTTNATAISGDALTTVSVTGGGAAAIDNDKTIDGTLTAGAGTTMTSVTLAKVEGDSTVKGKALTSLTIDGPTTAASSVTVTNSATGGHTLSLNLNGAGYEKTYTTAKTVTVTDTTATTVAVTTSGTKNSVDLGGASNGNTFTTLTMAGSGKAAVELGIATVQTIDASASSADLTFTNVNAATKTISTGSGKDTFTTATTTAVVDSGDGDDSVTINAALTAGATVATGSGNDTVLKGGSGSVATTTTATKSASKVDGGSGTDVIDVQLVNSGNAAQFVNFEVLGLDGTGSFDSDILSGITGLKQLDAGGATITNLEQTQSLESVHLGSSSATTTLTFTGSTVTGKEDAYSITLNASETSSTTTPTSANATHGTVVLNGIEDISIVSDGTAKVWNALTLGANNDAETVTISGDNNLDLAFASGFGEVSSGNGTTGVTLIDGSTATGKLSINITNVVEATANLTIKGGSGADTFTTIAGDTITLDGGAGTDNYVVAANVVPTLSGGATILDALVTITTLESGETIDIGGGTSTTPAALGAAQSTASATTLTAALNAINNATATTAWGEFAGNTYIVWDASGTTGDVAANDVVVKLNGSYDLSLSTIDANDIMTYVEVI